MVYAIQVDYLQRIELAEVAAGAEVVIGNRVDEFDAWLESAPEVIDTDKAQLMAALGVAP